VNGSNDPAVQNYERSYANDMGTPYVTNHGTPLGSPAELDMLARERAVANGQTGPAVYDSQGRLYLGRRARISPSLPRSSTPGR
jgi:hypothetical protein